MNIFEKIKLKTDIYFKYIPYLYKKEKELKKFKLLSEVSDEITSIYNVLRCDKKFYKYIEKYEILEKNITNHNDFYKTIVSEEKIFIYNDLLSDPLSIDVDYFSFITKELNKFTNLNSIYIKYKNDLDEIVSNYDIICKQYKVFNEMNDLFTDSNDFYYDGNYEKELNEKLNQLLKEIEKDKKEYYDFYKIVDIEPFINNHNSNYIKKHIEDNIFNDEGYDYNQRKSILCDPVSNLVIAGAGCGKTFTICGKTKYLLQEKKVKEEEILLLSFSRNSAIDLKGKISNINENLKVSTFHALGLRILEEVENHKFNVEEQYKYIIEKFFSEEVFNRKELTKKVLHYYSLFMRTNDDKEKVYSNKGELYKELKKQDFITLKTQLLEYNKDKKALETIKKELVKSQEELFIANYYFINGIEYEYEHNYEIDTYTDTHRQYKPDFFLPKYKLYHEHYGVDKNGEAHQFGKEENEKYKQGIIWKRQIHVSNDTKCIESYSYEFNDGSILINLERKLKENGVEFNPLTESEIKATLQSVYNGKDFKSFIILTLTFINLYKSLYQDENGFDILKKYSYYEGFLNLRSEMFLDICKEAYIYYQNQLRENNRIDFDHMINRATYYLDKTDKFKYKYIIVDEFQDISHSRMKFLKKLISHGNSKVFAVGDDWQSIYRFAGCDLSLFTKFEKNFFDVKKNYITTTFRNSIELQDIASAFVMKNNAQIKKKIESNKTLENPIQIMFYNQNKRQCFIELLNKIHRNNSNDSVLVLGRNNHDLETIKSDLIEISKDKIIKCNLYPNLNIYFKTVHSSKGLQENNVILINCEDSRLGFPNKVEDDPLLSLVLSEKDSYRYGEERRLFYVALTRTKTYTYLMVDVNKPSEFIDEIIDKCYLINKEAIKDDNPIYCPSCSSGTLKLRKYDGREFYGCSNYPYCSYTNNNMLAVENNDRCPRCNAFITVRNGRNGRFYGCTSYPRCDYKRKNK